MMARSRRNDAQALLRRFGFFTSSASGRSASSSSRSSSSLSSSSSSASSGAAASVTLGTVSRNNSPSSPIQTHSTLSSSTAATVIGWPPDFRNTTSPGSNGMASSCSWLGLPPYAPSMTDRSRPLHHRRQRGENRVDIAAGAQPEDGAAVVEQVELHVAAAAYELLLALGRAPRRGEIPAHQLGIDAQEGAADVLREGEVGRAVAAVEIVVEDATDAAHLVAMLQVEIFVAPLLVLRVRRHVRMRVAGLAHRGVKRDGVGIVLAAARIEHRRQVGADAEPGLAGGDEARVHVEGRHVQ